MSDSKPVKPEGENSFFTHPLLLVFATALLGGSGFLINKYIFTQQSMFRFSAQNIEQYIALTGDQPTFNHSVVYCGTVRMRLLLDHNGEGNKKVTIHRISARIDQPRNLIPKPTCNPDPLAGKPAGLTGTESIKVNFNGSNINAIKFLSRTDSRELNPENLLADFESAQTVTLKPDEESISFDVFVTSQVGEVREVFFEAGYDLGGEKMLQTDKILLMGRP